MSSSDNDGWRRIVAVRDVTDAGMLPASVGDRQILIYSSDGSFYATDNICTHAYALLSDGWLDNGEIECPLHGGRFDIKTGKALTSPVESDLTTYPLRIVEGFVEINIPEQG